MSVVAGKAKPLGGYPHFKRVGDFIFVSGTSARRADNSIAGACVERSGAVTLDIGVQTKAVIENISDILQAADSKLSDVVQVTTYLVDMSDFDAYNDVYNAHFDADGPTRTTVAVHQLPNPHLLVEMQAIAFSPVC